MSTADVLYVREACTDIGILVLLPFALYIRIIIRHSIIFCLVFSSFDVLRQDFL